MKLEDDVCFDNEVDDHVEMLKALYVNYKVSVKIIISLLKAEKVLADNWIYHQQQVHKSIINRQ